MEPCGLAGQSRLAQLFSCSQGDLSELDCCFSSVQVSEWIKELFPRKISSRELGPIPITSGEVSSPLFWGEKGDKKGKGKNMQCEDIP